MAPCGSARTSDGEQVIDGKLAWAFFKNLAAGFNTAAQETSWDKIERLTGMKKHVLQQWLTQRRAPLLKTIFRLCYVCEVTPHQIMEGQVGPLVAAIYRVFSSRTPVRRMRPPRIDQERCRDFIQAVLDGREKPLALRQIAKRLGCGLRTLIYWFPEECTLITLQAREYRRKQGEQRIMDTCTYDRMSSPSMHKAFGK